MWKKLLDPDRDLKERTIVYTTLIGVVSVFIVLLGNILIGENMVEIVVLVLTLILSPTISFLCIRLKKVDLGAFLIIAWVVFLILPVAYFYGGGLTGCVTSWFIFSYLYIGLILSGKTRNVMLLMLTILICALYGTSYFYPDLVLYHTRLTWYLDSSLSVLIVSFAVYIMVSFQKRLYIEENKRAAEQTREVEELNQTQNRFFSSMSHEIRTPINTIIGLNEMILREDISDEVAEDARNIQAASKILISVVNDILDMSKIESGHMELVNVSYRVGDMLSEITNMFWGKAKEKGLEFNIEVDPAVPANLFGDEVRIKQILINLLNNAVKYTEKGSITLSIHCHKTEDGKALLFYSVSDTGIGIRKENIPYLFDAFKRVDVKKNRYIEGTGLGLSIVKQLVTLMGGEVSVTSEYMKGSTFIVSLEQEMSDETRIGEFDPEAVRTAGKTRKYHQRFEAPGAKILIVDDNKTNLMVAAKLLKETRVKTTTASSGKEALKLTLIEHYDTIIMDHLMPEMDGIECLHAIREQVGGLCRETPVVVMTANAGGENKILYKNEGFDGYLLKPVDPVEFEETLMEVLPGDLVSGSSDEFGDVAGHEKVRRMKKKVPLMITTDSVSDLPAELTDTYGIPVLPYWIHTDTGIFADGFEASGNGIIRYMEGSYSVARSEAPEISDYENFFAEQLSGAQHILHIALAKGASKGYENSGEAALAFSNVEVFDSGHLSSGMGLVVLEAAKLVSSGVTDIDQIERALKIKSSKVSTSFIVDSTEYLYRGGRLSERMNRLCSSLLIHPILSLRKSQLGVSGIMLGRRDSTKKRYVRHVLRHPSDIDRSVLFITYAGMKRSELEEIRDYALSFVRFEKVYIQEASPAISINCGPGTFGLLFSRK